MHEIFMKLYEESFVSQLVKKKKAKFYIHHFKYICFSGSVSAAGTRKLVQ